MFPPHRHSFSIPLECMSNFTRGCQPVQRLMPYALLHLVARVSTCGPDSLPALPVPTELQPFLTCLQQFAFSFNTELGGSMDASVSVKGFVTCLLSTWDVGFLASQPPAYKVYWSQTLAFVRNIMLPAVQREALP